MNLFICNTPFQLYFSLKIITVFEITYFDIIFIGDMKNRKNIYYFNQISKKANDSIWLECNKKTFLFARDVRLKIKNKKYKSVYLASIDSIYNQLIISSIKFENLYTFDDGLANININSSYYIDRRKPYKKLIYMLLGNKFNLSRIKKLSKKHFTIYKQQNITNKTTYINILVDRVESNEKKGICNLILGSVYAEILSDINNKKILLDNLSQLIREFEGDILYLPHPRDITLVSQFENEYLSTDLIFEDIYSQLLLKYEKINIFSFLSSSLINLESDSKFIIKGNVFNQHYMSAITNYSSGSSIHSKFIEINELIN